MFPRILMFVTFTASYVYASARITDCIFNRSNGAETTQSEN